MRHRVRLRRVLAAAAVLALSIGDRTACGEPDPLSIQLIVDAGTPVRVALDRRIDVKRVGQPVTAVLLEPLYAYDRVVVPAGTSARGRIERIEPVPKKVRARAMLRGDFSPPHSVLVQFDALTLGDGRELAIHTSATVGVERVALQVAAPSSESGVASRVREAAAREAKQAIAVVTAPGKLERLRDFAIGSLPYRRRYLAKGTVYSARLASSLELGPATPTARAPAGTAVAPGSILNTRLITPLDSATALRGSRIEAVLTQPVFSNDRRLILPEGTRLSGQVTFVKRARSFHRNGQLRFLFENIQMPQGGADRLLAAVFSVESSRDDRIVLDEEGGAVITDSKARFIAPALSALALAGSMHSRLDYDTDGAGPEVARGGAGSSALGGFLGLGALGAVLGQVSRPLTLTLTVVGLARSIHATVLAKGREVVFPADTSMQLQLAPGPGATRPQ